MMEILKFTHQFLQKFCAGNQENQALLHKHLNLFLTPGVRRRRGGAAAQGQNSAPLLRLRAQDEKARRHQAGQEFGTVPAAP